jgi:hypothetical protein
MGLAAVLSRQISKLFFMCSSITILHIGNSACCISVSMSRTVLEYGREGFQRGLMDAVESTRMNVSDVLRRQMSSSAAARPEHFSISQQPVVPFHVQ